MLDNPIHICGLPLSINSGGVLLRMRVKSEFLILKFYWPGDRRRLRIIYPKTFSNACLMLHCVALHTVLCPDR